jgi:hypothetical protein
MYSRRGTRVAAVATALAITAGSLAASPPASQQTAPPAPQQASPPGPQQAAQLALPLTARPGPLPSDAPSVSARPLFRVILNDGTALVSFGEFTRVGDRVVFSMPLDSPLGDHLQLVNLPASTVNWEATEQYSIATRYAQYVATRAEADFAVLTGEVASALNEIALAKDPARRLQIAERARQRLVAWPLEHYGYRSPDVNDMLSLLAGTISELRDNAGVRRFDFSLVATIEPPTMPLLPDPSPTQAIDQVLLAARLSDVPAERITLLRSVLSAIDEKASELPRNWARQTRASAEAILEAELEIERRYSELSRSSVAKATTAAAQGDVRAVERAVATLQARDRELGQKRKDQVAGLLALLQERLDSARRLRLLRDQWARKAEALRGYQNAVSEPIDRLARLGPKLEDVKALAGPDVSSLPGLIQSFERVSRQFALITPPADMIQAHATLQSAAELGQQAMRTRERAAVQGDLATAWDASSAAAGSLMLLAAARRQIDALMRPPELR